MIFILNYKQSFVQTRRRYRNTFVIATLIMKFLFLLYKFTLTLYLEWHQLINIKSFFFQLNNNARSCAVHEPLINKLWTENSKNLNYRLLHVLQTFEFWNVTMRACFTRHSESRTRQMMPPVEPNKALTEISRELGAGPADCAVHCTWTSPFLRTHDKYAIVSPLIYKSCHIATANQPVLHWCCSRVNYSVVNPFLWHSPIINSTKKN